MVIKIEQSSLAEFVMEHNNNRLWKRMICITGWVKNHHVVEMDVDKTEDFNKFLIIIYIFIKKKINKNNRGLYKYTHWLLEGA